MSKPRFSKAVLGAAIARRIAMIQQEAGVTFVLNETDTYAVEEALQIAERTGKETRTVVLGHLQRGGGPTCADRLLCTRFGAAAAKLIQEEQYGRMVALRGNDTISVPIPEAIGRLRTVPPNGDIVETARMLGVSFGDEV